MSAFVHIDDSERASAYIRLCRRDCPPFSGLSTRDQLYAKMLIFTFWPDGNGFATHDAALERIQGLPSVGYELEQILAVTVDASRRTPWRLGFNYEDTPLFSHATYRREEVLAGLGWAGLEGGRKARGSQAGVVWCPATSTDALFVTLNKTERDFSPNTMYRDYALNPSLFHWESQTKASTKTPAGRRHVGQAELKSHTLLFTRNNLKDDEGISEAYSCLGPVDYQSHQGEEPIAVTWKLKRPMPADVFLAASAVAR